MESNVRAKFFVSAIKRYSYANSGVSIEMSPVTSGSDENKQFWASTPSGKIEMSIKSDAADAFVLGAEYYVDFSPALVAEPAR